MPVRTRGHRSIDGDWHRSTSMDALLSGLRGVGMLRGALGLEVSKKDGENSSPLKNRGETHYALLPRFTRSVTSQIHYQHQHRLDGPAGSPSSQKFDPLDVFAVGEPTNNNLFDQSSSGIGAGGVVENAPVATQHSRRAGS